MRSRTLHRVSHALRMVVLASAVVSSARAEEPRVVSPPGGQWGYWVVASSVALGGGVTSYGLTLDCKRGDDPCRWNTGLTIWGGVGLASFGSMIGLAIVREGSRNVRVGATVTGRGTPVLGAVGEF